MSRVQLGTWGIVTLVALRVGIGLHFFYEGADKLQNPKPFSAGFLSNAKGPFADQYKKMIWDPDGAARLDYEGTVDYWNEYAQQISRHYKFDDKQSKQAEQIVADFDGRLKNFMGRWKPEIDEYWAQLERRDKNLQDPARLALPSLQMHEMKITGERMKLKGQVVPGIDAMWKDLDRALNNVATSQQWKQHGELPIGKVGRRFGDSEMVDGIIPYFNLIVGACLVLGLFVRPAAVLGGLFLLTVCASQFPGTPGAAPIYYQGVEMLAMFALAAIGAGNLAGLDFFITSWLTSNKPSAVTAK